MAMPRPARPRPDTGRTATQNPGRYTLQTRSIQCVRVLTVVAAVMAAMSALAQDSLTVVPSVSVTMTATDNVDLAPNGRSDLITEVAPGIAIVSRRGPLQGALNYSLNGVAYARDSAANTVYHNLAANGRWTLMDGRVGLDATASAGRQIVSAFGTQSSDAYRARGNQAQVTSYSVSPHVAGPLLGNASYRGRLTYAQSRSDDSSIDSNTKSLVAAFGVGGRKGMLGWGVDASRAIYETPQTARAHNGSVVGSLSIQPDPEWMAVVRAGIEVDDILTGQSERVFTWGLGGQWMPTPRTVLRADYDRRFFGRSHALTFSHRTARTVWTLGDQRSFQVNNVGGRAVASIYDLFFAQFASIEPDPIQRDLLVRNFLAANGIDPNSSVVVGGFLSAGPTVQRSQSLAIAYQGLRNTLVLSLLRSDTRQIGHGSSAGDLSLTNKVDQRTVSLSLSHRLTPESSLIVSLSQQRTPDVGTLKGNDLQTIAATWSARFGRSTTGSLGLRYTHYGAESSPYNETALIGSLRMQF